MKAIKDLMAARHYRIAGRPFELNIVGIRSTAQSDTFNDLIVLGYTDDRSQEHWNCFPATTDPGRFWLQHPMRAEGTAILKPGQYVNAWQIGWHRGKYRALVQCGPVTVYRDNNKDDRCDMESLQTQTGYFGINIHRALQQGKTLQVDRHAAGCQVFQSAADFAQFMQHCERHRNLYGNRFSYTLLEETSLPEQTGGATIF